MSFLNNRELAIIIWLLILLILMLFVKKIRESFLNVLKIFTSKKIIIPIIMMLFYVFLMVYLFHRIGFWDTSKIKDTILWICCVAFIMFFNSNKTSGGGPFFQNALLDNLKLVVILEFIINLYVFNLVVELILIPILVILIIIVTFAEYKEELASVKNVTDWILGIVGLCFVLFALSNVFIDFQSFANMDNLHSFLLPPIFTLVFLPFIYLMSLYIQYENIFIRIDILNENKSAIRYAKRKIIALCHFNLKKINSLFRDVEIMRINNKNDVRKFFQKYKNK